MATKVLLTGASGFIAAHILELLVKRGYHVVATVRNQEKADFIKKLYPNAPIDIVFVQDIAAEKAFDEAVKDPEIKYVLHTASPFFLQAENDHQKEIIEPAVRGTVGILKALKAYAPQVSHVVVTSSIVAMADVFGPPPTGIIDESSWNPVTPEVVAQNPIQAYAASKTFAEQALWEFVKTEKPSFTVSTVNPPYVFGPLLHSVKKPEAINTSNKILYDFAHSGPGATRPDSGLIQWVDVRDVAEAHVRAFERSKTTAGKRLFVIGGDSHFQQVLDVLNERFPELRGKINKGVPLTDEEWKQLRASGLKYDDHLTREELGLKYVSFSDMVKDTVDSLNALDKEWGVKA